MFPRRDREKADPTPREMPRAWMQLDLFDRSNAACYAPKMALRDTLKKIEETTNSVNAEDAQRRDRDLRWELTRKAAELDALKLANTFLRPAFVLVCEQFQRLGLEPKIVEGGGYRDAIQDHALHRDFFSLHFAPPGWKRAPGDRRPAPCIVVNAMHVVGVRRVGVSAHPEGAKSGWFVRDVAFEDLNEKSAEELVEAALEKEAK